LVSPSSIGCQEHAKDLPDGAARQGGGNMTLASDQNSGMERITR
jgi:hypothetical protein